MKTIFDNQKMVRESKTHKISVDCEGVSYTSLNGKNSVELKFSEIGSIFPMTYCNSNQHYTLYLRNLQGKNICEIDTDTEPDNRGHNILETKMILVAFAASKLTKAFPENLHSLDITLAFSLKEKEIRISNGVISGAKHKVGNTGQ